MKHKLHQYIAYKENFNSLPTESGSKYFASVFRLLFFSAIGRHNSKLLQKVDPKWYVKKGKLVVSYQVKNKQLQLQETTANFSKFQSSKYLESGFEHTKKEIKRKC